MALNIKDAEADRLARELAAETGETLTEAVLNALGERLERQRKRLPTPRSAEDALCETRMRLLKMPVLDSRPLDELIGYDETGLSR